jgi:hypothetical protein
MPEVEAAPVAQAPFTHQPVSRRVESVPNAPQDRKPSPAPTAKTQEQPKAKAQQPAKKQSPQSGQATPELTDELRTQIEERYLALATPVEFNGIRTQIATELSVPKSLVRRAVAELIQRMQLPSWWELQAYQGDAQELARIRERYTPLLPMPPVGVHKIIASELSLDPMRVYRAIRRIRAEMRLPQYNPPDVRSGKGDSAKSSAAS